MLTNGIARIAVVFAACICAAVAVAQITSGPASKGPAAAATPVAAVPAVNQAAAPAAAPAAQPAAAPKGDEAAAALAAAFNRGSAKDVAALFLPDGEYTDDAGNVHKGRKELETVLTAYFEKFPGAQVTLKIASSRLLSPWMAIQEGEQTVVTKDGKYKAENEFTATLVHVDTGWVYANFTENAKEEELSLHERLEPLSWLVGDWVDEEPDFDLAFSVRWSDDKNFLIVAYDSRVRGKSQIKSEQRIGWDPLAGQVHSWIFDSDGGYGESRWTAVDKSWIVKSTAVLPDGQTGSATLVLEPVSHDKFMLKGLDRVLGDSTLPDIQSSIVRKPPQPAK